MFPGYVWQSQRCDSYQKACIPSWGGNRGSGPSTHPSGEVLACLLLPKRVFKCQFLYVWKFFCEVGLSQLWCIDLALGVECRVVRSGTQQCDTPSERASWYVYSGAICALSKAISEAISGCAASAGAPQITEFTVMGYPPLLLSDKISSSYLLPLLALRLLMPQSVCLLSCIRQVQQGHRLHYPPRDFSHISSKRNIRWI